MRHATTRVRVRHIGDDIYVGSIDCPTSAGRVITHGIGDSRADALLKASAIAERIASDPVMSALMPPQAQAAIAAAKTLASAAKSGRKTLRRVWGRIRGPGKQRLAQALMAEAKKHEDEAREAVDGLFSKLKRVARMKRSRPKRRAMPRREEAPPEDTEPEQADDEATDVEDVGSLTMTDPTEPHIEGADSEDSEP